MIKKEMKTEKARIWLDGLGIVHTIYFENSEITLIDAKSEINTIDNLNGGKRSPAIVDIAGVKSVSREARKYYGSEETARTLSATALLISSSLSKILANFFIGINKPIMPIKLFTSEAEAVEWLKGFVTKEDRR